MSKSKRSNTATDNDQHASPRKPRRKNQENRLPKQPPNADVREQLYNEGQVGPIEEVQVSTERIVKLNGILLDLDPCLLKQGPLIPTLPADPDQFFEQVVQPWLARQAVLNALEIRMSGTGLHGIMWLDPQVVFVDDAERDRWCRIVQIVQCTLPTDPNAPGITATTRSLDSVNSKNGQTVRLLRKGRTVLPEDVIALQQQMCASPFKTLLGTLTGSDRVSSCPICGQEGTTLNALDHVGMCYGCGKVTFERLCNELFQPTKSTDG